MFINAINGSVQNDGSFILGNRGHGEVGSQLEQVYFEPGLRRPYLYKGRPHVTLNVGMNSDGKPKKANVSLEELAYRQGIYSPVANATLLPQDIWRQIDTAVIRAQRQRLRAWRDLMARNPRSGFNAMGRLTFEYMSMSDAGEALKDMDAVSEGRADQPTFDIKSVPLPIIHSDFYFTERQLAVFRNGGMQLDTTMIEMAGRRCAEMVERTLIGTETGMTYGTRSTGQFPMTGTSTEYGYTNFPYRITKTDLHSPTSANPENVVEDILEMRETLRTQGYFGPYMVYHSTGYDRFLDDDYFRTGGTSVNRTLRERVGSIEGIQGFTRLDYLSTGYQLLMIEMTPQVVEAINGMEFTTVMWEVKGGLEYHFKVMGIQVPLLKAPLNGVAGIVHGTTS